MYQSTNVLAVVGARPRRGQGSVESMDFPDIFLCLTCSALDRWGKKTDISVPCPMSRGAKQDLPFVRQLSVVFLSANEFWKSENSREKVHTRCALGFMSVLYTLLMKITSLRLTRNSQEMADSYNLSIDERIYIESSVIHELFYSHGGLCRDEERLADRSVRARFLFLRKRMRWLGNLIADSRPFRGNIPYLMKIRNRRHKVNENKIRLKKTLDKTSDL